mmetsp:Transcript_115077/g.245852  ORF Transcript_115077/g.245852 Transcript_115077/m.245852 type:complete len:240 (+) Transcript_115077:622-1341(+)
MHLREAEGSVLVFPGRHVVETVGRINLRLARLVLGGRMVCLAGEALNVGILPQQGAELDDSHACGEHRLRLCAILAALRHILQCARIVALLHAEICELRVARADRLLDLRDLRLMQVLLIEVLEYRRLLQSGFDPDIVEVRQRCVAARHELLERRVDIHVPLGVGGPLEQIEAELARFDLQGLLLRVRSDKLQPLHRAVGAVLANVGLEVIDQNCGRHPAHARRACAGPPRTRRRRVYP